MGVLLSQPSPSEPPIHDDRAFNILARVFSQLKDISIDEAKEKILNNIRQHANETLANQPNMPFESVIKEAFDAVLCQIKDEEISSRAAKIGLNYNTCSSAKQFRLRAKWPLYMWNEQLNLLTLPKMTFYFKHYLAKDGSSIKPLEANDEVEKSIYQEKMRLLGKEE